eukprot:768529-Hanusia_phi.AAC.7
MEMKMGREGGRRRKRRKDEGAGDGGGKEETWEENGVGKRKNKWSTRGLRREMVGEEWRRREGEREHLLLGDWPQFPCQKIEDAEKTRCYQEREEESRGEQSRGVEWSGGGGEGRRGKRERRAGGEKRDGSHLPEKSARTVQGTAGAPNRRRALSRPAPPPASLSSQRCRDQPVDVAVRGGGAESGESMGEGSGEDQWERGDSLIREKGWE